MKKEGPPTVELDRDMVQAYAATFIPRFDLYPMQLADGTYICVKKPLDLSHVTQHLQGRRTLGAYALDTHSQARWICLDADDDQQWRGLLAMARDLAQQAITAYLEPSRRGGHLWLFTPVLAGRDAREFGQQLLAHHNLQDLEVFPKQDQLVTGPGSLVRLPLGIHRKTGKRYHFVTLAGAPLAPTIREQVRLLTVPRRVPQAFIDGVLADRPAPDPVAPTPTCELPAGEGEGATLSERLKGRISVHEFVSQYVELDSQGRGHCPFHEDQHKSFGVNAERNFWHCFAGCGGGSILDFWGKWRAAHGEDPDFSATLKDLADMLL